MAMTEPKEAAPAPDGAAGGDRAGVEGAAAAGVEPGAPTCPRGRWFQWRQEREGAEGEPLRHPWCRRFQLYHDGPPQPDSSEWREWKEWKDWRERRWMNRCSWRGRQPGAAEGGRAPLDDSRWLEDFFSWY